eukprot:11182884-Lingulodinium_polyedra.AAC.1
MQTPKDGVRMERARRAICEPLRRQTADPTTSLRTVSKTVHTDAVESTVRGRNASQITRLAHSMQTPRNCVCME